MGKADFESNEEAGGPKDYQEDSVLIKKIEKAYRIYKISESHLKNATDDYGKFKIASLRIDFAKHELEVLIKQALEKGIKIKNTELLDKFYFPKS